MTPSSATTIPQMQFPTALISREKAQRWQYAYLCELQAEMRHAAPREQVITRCEEHIAMCVVTMRALR